MSKAGKHGGRHTSRTTGKADDSVPSDSPSVGWFMLQAYRRRLRATIAEAPSWLEHKILSASEHIGEGRPAVWLSEN